MTIALYLHIGYLINVDAWGFAAGWGVPPIGRRGPGMPRYKHNLQIQFPWWAQPGAVQTWLFVEKLKRKQARAERRKAAS
jgi:hypothetical protein